MHKVCRAGLSDVKQCVAVLFYFFVKVVVNYFDGVIFPGFLRFARVREWS